MRSIQSAAAESQAFQLVVRRGLESSVVFCRVVFQHWKINVYIFDSLDG